MSAPFSVGPYTELQFTAQVCTPDGVVLWAVTEPDFNIAITQVRTAYIGAVIKTNDPRLEVRVIPRFYVKGENNG